jgi:hypothetical protein
MVDDCPGAVVGVDLGAVGKIAVLPKALRGKEGVHRKVHRGKDGAVGVVTGQQQGRRMNPISLLGDDDGCAADDAACGAGGVGVGALISLLVYLLVCLLGWSAVHVCMLVQLGGINVVLVRKELGRPPYTSSTLLP